jgi:hypothetical protein
MTCPLCSEPMLFGATTCACGYKPASSSGEDSSIELSYFEALRAYWRIYWPTQLFMALGLALAGGTLFDTLVQILLGAVGLFLFLPRITRRPYRGFSIVVSSNNDSETGARMTWRQRVDLWAFLWWRQILASFFAIILSLPLTSVLGIMGINVAPWIGLTAGVFAIGPILLKMMIGHPFAGFALLARRSALPQSETSL